MVQLVLGMSELPRPDDAADALAIAAWAANTERLGQTHTAAVMDRAAIAPIDRSRVQLRPGGARGARPGTHRQAQRVLTR